MQILLIYFDFNDIEKWKKIILCEILPSAHEEIVIVNISEWTNY